MLHITSKDNAQYKHLKDIATSARDRRKNRQTLIDGVHLLSALADSNGRLDAIVLREGSHENKEIKNCYARFSDTSQIVLSAKLFDSISPVETPVGILGLYRIPESQSRKISSAVLLENIQDPGNIGNILRTAAAAGVDAVYLSPGCAEAWSPKAVRAGMGAHFTMPIFEQQVLENIAEQFQTRVSTTLNAKQSLYEIALTGSVAFIFGNEGAGLSDMLVEKATHNVIIPMPGKIESLNVGSAVAVCVFERVRQLLRHNA